MLIDVVTGGMSIQDAADWRSLLNALCEKGDSHKHLIWFAIAKALYERASKENPPLKVPDDAPQGFREHCTVEAAIKMAMLATTEGEGVMVKQFWALMCKEAGRRLEISERSPEASYAPHDPEITHTLVKMLDTLVHSSSVYASVFPNEHYSAEVSELLAVLLPELKLTGAQLDSRAYLKLAEVASEDPTDRVTLMSGALSTKECLDRACSVCPDSTCLLALAKATKPSKERRRLLTLAVQTIDDSLTDERMRALLFQWGHTHVNAPNSTVRLPDGTLLDPSDCLVRALEGAPEGKHATFALQAWIDLAVLGKPVPDPTGCYEEPLDSVNCAVRALRVACREQCHKQQRKAWSRCECDRCRRKRGTEAYLWFLLGRLSEAEVHVDRATLLRDPRNALLNTPAQRPSPQQLDPQQPDPMLFSHSAERGAPGEEWSQDVGALIGEMVVHNLLPPLVLPSRAALCRYCYVTAALCLKRDLSVDEETKHRNMLRTKVWQQLAATGSVETDSTHLPHDPDRCLAWAKNAQAARKQCEDLPADWFTLEERFGVLSGRVKGSPPASPTPQEQRGACPGAERLRAEEQAQKIARMQGELSAAQARASRAQQSLRETQLDAAHAAEVAGAREAALTGQVAELTGQVAELTGQVAELTGQVAELQAQVAELSGLVPRWECPITMEDTAAPVLAPDTYVYDREAVTGWLHREGTSPQTREPMHAEELIPVASEHDLREKLQTMVRCARRELSETLQEQALRERDQEQLTAALQQNIQEKDAHVVQLQARVAEHAEAVTHRDATIAGLQLLVQQKEQLLAQQRGVAPSVLSHNTSSAGYPHPDSVPRVRGHGYELFPAPSHQHEQGWRRDGESGRFKLP
jgi:hypothetical protein